MRRSVTYFSTDTETKARLEREALEKRWTISALVNNIVRDYFKSKTDTRKEISYTEFKKLAAEMFNVVVDE